MPEPNDPERPTPLEYRDKQDDHNGRRMDRGALVGTALAATLVCALVLFGSIWGAGVLTYTTEEPLFMLLPIFVMVAVLVAGVHFQRRNRTLGAGILIGLGLALLLGGGTCFLLVY